MIDQSDPHSVFLSVVLVVNDQADNLPLLSENCVNLLSNLVSDFEIIFVDNASKDDSVQVFKRLVAVTGHPNLQVYSLSSEVDSDTASWVGLENALGDFVAVIDPLTDDIHFLPEMLKHALAGSDVVFASNTFTQPQSVPYTLALGVFNLIYRRFNGIHLSKDAPNYRLLNKRVVNYILQHPQPNLSYRHLPAKSGFSKTNLVYSAKPLSKVTKKLAGSIDRGMRLLVSTTRAPMRVATSLCLFGAVGNLFYSGYVVAVAFLKPDVAPGWISLSLQQSGMFFLMSLVLLVLSEYILQMASLSNQGPPYHVGQELTSSRITRKEKLNIEDASTNKIVSIDPSRVRN